MKRTRRWKPGPRRLMEKPVRVHFRMDADEYEKLIDFAARLQVHTSELLRGFVKELIAARVKSEGAEAHDHLVDLKRRMERETRKRP